MKSLDDYVEDATVIWETIAASKSVSGLTYKVQKHADGTWSCPCRGRRIYGICHHVAGGMLLLDGRLPEKYHPTFKEMDVEMVIKTGAKKAVAICPNCKAKVVEYKQGLNKPLIRGLAAIARTGDEPIAIAKLNIHKEDWTNFPKLQYFDLVQPYYDGEERVGGVWYITTLGRDFITGKVAIHKYAWTFRGKRVRYEGPLVKVDEIFEGYQYKEDWAAEANPVGNDGDENYV